MRAPQSPNIFISYSREDVGIVEYVVQVLELAGAAVWVDIRQLKYGQRWRHEVVEAIAKSDRVIVFWGKHAAASEEVLAEIQIATDLQKLIVPVSLDGEALPPNLKEFHGMADLRSSFSELRSYVNSGIPRALLGKRILGSLFATV